MMYLLLTFGCFFGFRLLFRSMSSPLANPLLWSILTIIPLLLFTDLSLIGYEQANAPLIRLLEPAVVALAIPLYQQLPLIRQYFTRILLSTFMATVLAMSSVLLIARLFTDDLQLLVSMLPKSVTSPIAIAIAEQHQGFASLAAALVIAVGLFGALFGFSVMKLTGITDPKAQGLAMGASAHAIGTAKALQTGPTEGSFSSLALVLCGIQTALLAPVFVWLLTLSTAG